MPKLLLFTDKKITPTMLITMSRKLKNKAIVAEIKDSEIKLCKRFKIDTFPSLINWDEPDKLF